MKKRAINILVNLDLIIACISLVTLTVLTFVGVITRYAFHSPISWQGEIQILCYIWLVYFGLSTVVRYGNHISIDIIVDALPEKTAKVVRVLDLVIFMVVLVFTAYQGSMLVKQLFVTNRISGVLDFLFSYAGRLCIDHGELYRGVGLQEKVRQGSAHKARI